VRALVRELTGEPVTCGHELTSKLDAPRRALTAALNARLIPQLQQLVQAVEGLLARKGIKAPLMVVKGDGSLIKSGPGADLPGRDNPFRTLPRAWSVRGTSRARTTSWSPTWAAPPLTSPCCAAAGRC
jgi:hypothetical protein